MSFSAVDLSQYDIPAYIDVPDFEVIFNALLGDLQRLDPVFDALVESDPAYKILQVAAYRELQIRQDINDQVQQIILTNMRGELLTAFARENHNVERLLITPANNDVTPPTPAIYESDADLIARVQLSPEGFSTAGPVGAYVFHARSAHPSVKDVQVSSPTPKHVRVTVLTNTGQGEANSDVIQAVDAALNDDKIRPLTDYVTVQSAQIVTYRIKATLVLLPGPDKNVVLEQATTQLTDYVNERHALGATVSLSGIYAALHVSGVSDVLLETPSAPIEGSDTHAPFCTQIDVVGQVLTS